MKIQEHFTKIPNRYIKCCIKDDYGIGRCFYGTYLLIDRYRSTRGYACITIGMIIDFHGFKRTKAKPKIFYEIIDVLRYMADSNMIEICQDLDSVGYDTGIKMKVIAENFEPKRDFTIITESQLARIERIPAPPEKENLLAIFLYVVSHIGARRMTNDGSEMLDASYHPEAFYRSVEDMAIELNIARSTIIASLEKLSHQNSGDDALLVKKDVGFIYLDDDKPRRKFPNIYALNAPGYSQELEWAERKMKESYLKREISSVRQER